MEASGGYVSGRVRRTQALTPQWPTLTRSAWKLIENSCKTLSQLPLQAPQDQKHQGPSPSKKGTENEKGRESRGHSRQTGQLSPALPSPCCVTLGR